MRVVCLDIDGVLTARNKDIHDPTPPSAIELRYLKNVPYKQRDYNLSWFRALVPECVMLLDQLVERTWAKIVIASSWGSIWTIYDIQHMLAGHGFRGEVIGVTPRHLNLFPKYEDVKVTRGHEIQEWLNVHPEVSSYVIIDDCGWGYLDPQEYLNGFENRLVLVAHETGLTQANVDLACSMLQA
jgi:hypothetical protein